VSGDPQLIRFAMTILQVSRALRPPVGKVDYSTITEPEKKDILVIPVSFINLFIKDFRLVAFMHTLTLSSFFLN